MTISAELVCFRLDWYYRIGRISRDQRFAVDFACGRQWQRLQQRDGSRLHGARQQRGEMGANGL